MAAAGDAAGGRRWPSLGAAVQYVVFAVVAYIFAGAPLQSLLLSETEYAGTTRSHSRASVGKKRADVRFSREKLQSLVVPDRNLSCAEHAFRGVYVLSREPLVVYIEGFLTNAEAEHVLDVSNAHFEPSTVWTSGNERLDPTVRLSEKAQVPRDTAVQCIEQRARMFQGWRPYVFIEKLWAQRYGLGGHYTYHYDWSTATPGAGRVSSFMVWLVDECTGGGTSFPRLSKPIDKSWCKFIECGEEQAAREGDEWGEEDMGTVFKPIKGSAVFWENMRADGTGYEESWHAGLPVISGTKVGLNIWSWLQEGYEPSEAEEQSGADSV